MSYCSCAHPQYTPPSHGDVKIESYVKVVAGGFTDELKDKLENIEEFANNYKLPTASDTTLGGVKVGKGLIMSEDGILSIDPDEICDCGDSQILDGGDADGEPDVIQYLDGGAASGLI